MKLLLAAVLLVLPLAAQTTISQSGIIGADGSLASGTVRITPSQPFTTPGGVYVGAQATVRVVNGAFSIALWPNDTGTPANTYYYARWQLNNARPDLQIWAIPTCGRVLDVAQAQATVVTVA